MISTEVKRTSSRISTISGLPLELSTEFYTLAGAYTSDQVVDSEVLRIQATSAVASSDKLGRSEKLCLWLKKVVGMPDDKPEKALDYVVAVT